MEASGNKSKFIGDGGFAQVYAVNDEKKGILVRKVQFIDASN